MQLTLKKKISKRMKEKKIANSSTHRTWGTAIFDLTRNT